MVLRYKTALKAYRIADGRHPLFDGQGAAQFGARWNSPGHWVIYAARTFSGAMLEKLIHCGTARLPKHQCWITITGEEILVEELAPEDLPGWDRADQFASRAYGDSWYQSARSLVLMVPSVVARQEYNVLINQRHPDFGKLSASVAQPVLWDERLFRQD